MTHEELIKAIEEMSVLGGISSWKSWNGVEQRGGERLTYAQKSACCADAFKNSLIISELFLSIWLLKDILLIIFQASQWKPLWNT